MPLKIKISELPDYPGVYLLKDRKGRIIYVGKARNLKERLRAYTTSSFDIKKSLLIRKAENLDFIVTESEVEALVLEENLIKLNKPKFNVRLKDDKKFPYLKITVKDRFPKVFQTRNLKPDGSVFFGPFTSAKSLKKALKGVKRVFQLRTCSKKIPSGERPCLNFQLRRCLAPCQGNIEESLYRERVNQVIAFLQGKSLLLEQEIEQKMAEAAKKEDFERAAILRDQLFALRDIRRNQEIVFSDRVARDIIGLSLADSFAYATLFKIREGKIVTKEGYPLTLTKGTSEPEILETILRTVYTHTFDIPAEIILPLELEDSDTFIKWFLEKRNRRVRIFSPKKGQKKRLLNLAQKNAEFGLYTEAPIKPKLKIHPANLELKRFLGLEDIPRRIEGVDISNIQGKFATGSIVVFVDYYPKKSEYRNFRIKTVSGPDDYRMIQEVLRRRVKRTIDENKPLPDLVLIDGGKGQLSAAQKIYEEFGFKKKIPVLAFAKKTDTLFYEDGKEITIPAYSPALKLLKRIRDEAHRFAITYHKKLRDKKIVESELDKIKGIGEKRKMLVLRYFGSVERLRLATIKELHAVAGVGRAFAERIYEFFHQ